MKHLGWQYQCEREDDDDCFYYYHSAVKDGTVVTLPVSPTTKDLDPLWFQLYVGTGFPEVNALLENDRPSLEDLFRFRNLLRTSQTMISKKHFSVKDHRCSWVSGSVFVAVDTFWIEQHVLPYRGELLQIVTRCISPASRMEYYRNTHFIEKSNSILSIKRAMILTTITNYFHEIVVAGGVDQVYELNLH